MPTPIATVTKATIRADAAGADRLPGTTTSGGSSTTAIDSGLATYQPDFFRGKYLLLTSGAFSGQWRLITDFTSSSGTITVAPAFGGTVATSVTYEVYAIRPDLFTLAANRAVQMLYPHIHKPELDYIIASKSSVYGVPRGMRDVRQVILGSVPALLDRFDRADSTTSIGGSWVATTDTWGITSERGYSVTDADGGLITYDADMQDGAVSAVVRGTLNSGATYRSPVLVFRLLEDRTGAIPAAASRDYLLVRMLNAVVDLRKVDAGTESSVTTAVATTSDGVDYRLRVLFEGTRVRVFIDDVQLIDYELLGLNLKYLDGVQVGIRWDKGGAPATAARVDDYRAYHLDFGNRLLHHDWRQSADRRTMQFGAIGRFSGVGIDRLLRVEGTELLTLLAADTTYGTLATDSTATLEITTTEPAYQLFVQGVRAELYEYAQDPSWNQNLETIPVYQQLEAKQRLMVDAMKRTHGMPLPQRGLQFAY